MRNLHKRILCTAAAAALAWPAQAQDLAETKLNVITMFSSLNGYKIVELPFWTEEIPERSGGKVTAEVATLDQLNLSGGEVMRLLALGTTDVASSAPVYLTSEVPAMGGLELPGLFVDLNQQREGMNAYRPVLEKIFEENYQAKLLAVWALSPSMLFCRDPINSLHDLKGKKIRSWSVSLNTFFEQLGATPVSISFSETVPALERGTIDCAPTGILSGNIARWWEVANNLYLVPIGSGTWLNAMSLDKWNSLTPEVQAFMSQEMARFEDRMWDLAQQETDEGIACNTGEGECTLGVKASMTVTSLSEAEMQDFNQRVKQFVVDDWLEACSDTCKADWYASVGTLVGIAP